EVKAAALFARAESGFKTKDAERKKRAVADYQSALRLAPKATFADAARSAPRGSTLTPPWTPVWTPAPLTVDGKKLTIPQDAPKGRHTVFGRVGNAWRLLPIDVIAPLEIVSAELTWPGDRAAPALRVKMRCDTPRPIDAAVRATLAGLGRATTATVRLQPKSTDEALMPLAAMQPGRRYVGKVLVKDAGDAGRAPLETPVDLTLIPCGRLGGAAKSISAQPAMDISAWAPFDGPKMVRQAIAAADCSATVRTGYDKSGLHFRIEVRDDSHFQPHPAKYIWRADSVQLSFDLDAD
ncbi:MAG: hypothetical protein GY844_05180, partial [Bradyrhizobium sp.]|nr:hypothetical protein [Bradyrhizobium sp.]